MTECSICGGQVVGASEKEPICGPCWKELIDARKTTSESGEEIPGSTEDSRKVLDGIQYHMSESGKKR
jgi:hypothetical protein